jgi:glutathione S-transferase
MLEARYTCGCDGEYRASRAAQSLRVVPAACRVRRARAPRERVAPERNNDMGLEIFWGSGSGPSWRVLLAATIKGVPFESRLLSFSAREHKTPEMLAMNPRGKVPVLRDGAYTLYESFAIVSYLDRKFPAPPLFGATPEEAGTVVRTVMEHECYGAPAIGVITRALLFNRLADYRESVEDGLPTLRAELQRLEAQLGERAWLVGEAISAADVFVFPTIKTLERALSRPGAAAIDHGLRPLGATLPRLAAWVARVEALPGYAATYPPHWRES